MSEHVVVVGGGHNGLVAAAYLAKAGRRVTVFERCPVLGGVAATEELFPGFRVNPVLQDAGLLLPRIVEELALQSRGLRMTTSASAVTSLGPSGEALTLWRDLRRGQQEIDARSSDDGARFSNFMQFLNGAARALKDTRTRVPPALGDGSTEGLRTWIRPAIRVRAMGRRGMMELLRVLPMSAAELLNDWFETDLLKGALGISSVIGADQGPMAGGTAYRLLYHCLGSENGGFRSTAFVRGGIGNLASLLAEAAAEHGAQVETETPVGEILVRDGVVVAVRLEGGEEVPADRVISSVDPRQTLFKLVGAPRFGPEFSRRVANIRYRGTTAVLHLALDSLPTFEAAPDPERLDGHVVICPSLEYLERAHDDAKYGCFSARPALDLVIPTLTDPDLAPDGRHLMSVTIRYAPYELRGGSWKQDGPILADRVVSLLEEHAPGLSKSVLHRRLITPMDLEQDYGLTEGAIHHGQMDLDQLLFMRPVPGWGRYRTPIRGLYLGGAGVHPGGGVTGAPGYNAARAVLSA